MTYGVPYSFVPGTKAKADEVNANFIDILNKIEDTNKRVDDTNSQSTANVTELTSKIEDVKNSCLNLDLSNLSDNGKKVLNAKADASLLDGTWSNKSVTLCSSKGINASNTHTFSLASYLPKDNKKYEVLIMLTVDFPPKSNSQAALYLSTDFLTSNTPMVRFRSGQNVSTYAAASAFVIVSTDRQVKLMNTSFGINTATYSLKAIGYRKVR